MAAKKKNGFLTYLLIVVVVICISLVIIELTGNTLAELQTNGSQQEYVVNSEELPDYREYTPQPTPTYDPRTPTSDEAIDQYYDTGE